MFVFGDVPVDDTLYCPFDTFDSDGASVTISGLAVTDIEIYKDGSVTQRASDNGYALLDTDGIDFDGAVGLHGFSVDLSDNSDASFYAAGSTYWINVNAITVDSQTVRFTYHFTIGKLLRPTTAGRKLDVNDAGEAGLDLDNTSGTIDAAQLGADCITNAKIADDAIAAENLKTGALTADAFAADALVAATFATGAFTADAFAADALVAATFATGSLTADAFAADALVAATFATGAFTADVFAANALAAATFAASSLNGKGDWNTTTPPTVTEIQAEMEENGASVLDTIRDLLVDGGTIDQLLDDIKAVTDALPDAGALSTIGTDTARLTAVRAAVLTDWINGGRLDLILDAILAMLDDARTEPGQGTPAVNPDAMTKLDYLYKAWRNKSTQTATVYSLFADDAATVDHKATISDDATTATKGEIASGP